MLTSTKKLSIFLLQQVVVIAADVDESRLSKYGTLFVALRVAYTIMYVIQSRSTSMFAHFLFLWNLAMSMNLIREFSENVRLKIEPKRLPTIVWER